MLIPYLEKLTRFENLTMQETVDAFANILNHENEIQAGALLSLLRAKGETVDEIYGLYQELKNNMIVVPVASPILDIVGTGGDKTGTVNISTASALLAASCGVKILKHGAHAISSQCGSADVLEALGVNIHLTPEDIAQCVETTNFGFCYAPNFHPLYLKLCKLRRALSIPTTFNLLGPLLNPGCAEYVMMGVYKEEMLTTFSEVLTKLPIKHALVFHTNGCDEIYPCPHIRGFEIKNHQKKIFKLELNELNLKPCQLSDLQGGDAKFNAQLILEAFSGKKSAISDTFILNAGIANYLYGITSSIPDGVLLAQESLFSGFAQRTLKKIIHESQLFNNKES